MSVVFDETETTRGFVETIESHDQAFDTAAFAEELVNLLFGGVERQVADIKRRRIFELVLRLW